MQAQEAALQQAAGSLVRAGVSTVGLSDAEILRRAADVRPPEARPELAVTFPKDQGMREPAQPDVLSSPRTHKDVLS